MQRDCSTDRSTDRSTAETLAAPTAAPTAEPVQLVQTEASSDNDNDGASQASASITLTVPLDVDCSSVTPAKLTELKAELLQAAAAAGGFNATDVERIELEQNGKAVTRRQRATNGAVTARVIFKDTATVDLTAAVASLNEAIESGAVSVTVIIDGKEITAKVDDLAVFVESDGILNFAGATTAKIFVPGLVAIIAGIATLV